MHITGRWISFWQFFYFTFLELQESNVRLKLTVVDSVGFGDQINKEDRSVFPLYNHFKRVFWNFNMKFKKTLPDCLQLETHCGLHWCPVW